MLNGVVLAQFCQMKAVCPVRPVHEVGGKLGREEAEGWGKVERLPDFEVEFFEGNVLPVVGEYAVVCQCVQHGAGRSGIAVHRGNILGPIEVMPWGEWRDHLASFERRKEEIDDEEGKVPEKDKDLDEEAADFTEDAHRWSSGRSRSHLDDAVERHLRRYL